MRRFVGRGKRQKDFDNAIGSPAGVEMNDYGDNDDAHAQLDNLVYSAQNTDPSARRVVSPTPNVRAGSPDSVDNMSVDSNFDVQETLGRASRPSDPDTPSRLGRVIDEKYKTPNRGAGQQQVPMSTASSVGPTVQFNDIGFSPDFSKMDKDAEGMSEKSSDAGDYSETFGEQIDELNDLLTTPGKVLGDLGDTLVSPEDDDSVDKELEDLEGNSMLLSKELSQVGWYETGVVKKDTTSKQLFGSSPGSKGAESPASANESDYDQLFSSSPDPRSKASLTSNTIETPQKTSSSPGDKTPSISNKKRKEEDPASSFQLPSVFGFSKTPVQQDSRLGITRNPIAEDGGASDVSSSAASSAPSASGSSSIFQSLANFSAMVGDSLTSPSGKNQSQESPTSQPSLMGEELLFDAGSTPQDTPSKQLSTDLQTVSPIRKDQPRGNLPAPLPSQRGGQTIDDFDANTDSVQQPLINSQQQQHILPRTPDRQKVDDNLKVQAAHPGLPSPGGMVSPHVYADDTMDEEDGFYVRVNKNPNDSVMSQCTQDIEVFEKEPEPKERMTTRQIACLCGFMVVVVVCALLIALFATDMLGNMDDDPDSAARSPSGPIVINVPSFTSDPTSFPTRRPTLFPTALEPTLEEFDIGYNIRIADGEANSIPSSAYAPDLIESMDRLSVGVLGSIQEGKDPSTLYERRRLSSLVLPSTIVSIAEEECPNANGRDRCERIIAGLSLSDDSEISDMFRNTLQEEVTSGGLQFFLQQVNPDSPISILDPAQVPGITPAPSIAILMPPTAPSAGPDDPETALPTKSPALAPAFPPAFQPSPETPPIPNPFPQPTPRPPTDPITQPSPSPPTDPITQPTPSPPTDPITQPTPSPPTDPITQPTPSPPTDQTTQPTLSPPTDPITQPTPTPPTAPITQSTSRPTTAPSPQPTPFSTSKPTLLPTARPTARPTSGATPFPTAIPSSPPIFKATPAPTLSPSKSPTVAPKPTVYDLLVSKSFDGGDALLDSSSAQHNALMWLLTNEDVDKYDEQQLVQRYVMATLYFSTDGTKWLNNNDWLTNEDECKWFSKAGQGACKGGKLENLELDYNNLNGFLPEELGLLSNTLERIVLHGGPDESLGGSIPTTIGYLTKLRLLFIPNNSMEGALPSEIGNLSLLQQINLSYSQIQGSLPSEIGRLTSLVTFDVSGNDLTGLPTEIGMMEKANKILLHNNKFEGPIPSEIGQIRRLKQLEAYANSFDSIPSEIGELVYCEMLKLQDNNIQGPVPTELGELRRLRFLDLGNNLFTGNIPSEIGKLVELKSRLSLARNLIRGSIPTELGKLDKLRIIDLRRNRLSGSIPEELSGMKKISTIHLDNNDLEGEIPVKLCNLYDRTFPEFSTDCAEFDDSCPCCTTCCAGDQCTCRYEGTPQAYLCFSRTAEIEP